MDERNDVLGAIHVFIGRRDSFIRWKDAESEKAKDAAWSDLIAKIGRLAESSRAEPKEKPISLDECIEFCERFSSGEDVMAMAQPCMTAKAAARYLRVVKERVVPKLRDAADDTGRRSLDGPRLESYEGCARSILNDLEK